MSTLLLSGMAMAGLLFGSFGTVLLDRVPEGRSVVTPRSACDHCGRTLAWFDNVPVLSWALQRGRCRTCAGAIPWQYPVMEAGTAALCVLVTLIVGWTSTLPALIAVVVAGVPLALIDLRHHRLPNAIVLPLIVICAALLVGTSLPLGEQDALVRAGVGAALSAGFYLGLSLLPGQPMGMGDVKLSIVLGMVLGHLGWEHLAVGTFAGFVLGSAWGVVLLAQRRAHRRTAIPFGPFMLLGALVAVVLDPTTTPWF